jgi:DNA-binding NarL/FixJ family response regulator
MATPESDRVRRLALARDTWSLTPRQLAVLEHLIHGDASKTIADKLGCRVNTVEVHVSAILKKAQVSSRAALVARFWTDLGTTPASE